MSKYEFAQLHNRGEDWMVRQYVMRARFAESYARNAGRVLDIASGSGYLTYHLAKANPDGQVVGVDLSPDAVKYASDMYQAPNLSFAQGDGFGLRYPTGHFDLVVTFETIEHVPDGERLVKELARVTSRDGTLLISTPYDGFDFPDPTHINTYEPQGLFALLRYYFEEVDEYYQFLTDQDRAAEWVRIEQIAVQQRSSRRQVRAVAAGLMPRPIKDLLKRWLGMDSPARPYVLSDKQNYMDESVSKDVQRVGSTPFIIVGVCRLPRRKQG